MINAPKELHGKRVLVTGAAGFIGSKVVEMLLTCKAEVVAMVDDDALLDRIAVLLDNPELHLVRCPLDDMRRLSEQRQKWGEIDYLAHLWVKVPANPDFCERSSDDINMNLLPAINLIKALGNSLKGICFASSVSVYGRPARLPVKETDLAMPRASYGVTKLALENYLRAYGKTMQIPVTVLRYSSVYGPGELGHRAIPNFIHNVAEGKPPVINGDGSEIRDYVYIDDVVRATVQAIASRPDAVLNIGSGQGRSTLDIARNVMRLYPAEMEPKFMPTDQPDTNIVCDISAAGEALAYSPRTTLEDGLVQEITWFKKHAAKSTQKTKKSDKARRLLSYSLLKSAIDRTVACTGVIILSPVMALIALVVKLDSRSSAIFTQERVGLDGRGFTIYKFRTMHPNGDDSKYKQYLNKYVMENAPYRVDDNGTPVYKVDDAHFTRFGAVLRKTNLDELPQLFNVLKGDMSLVGPRPDIPYAVQMYNDWHRERLRAKPGMTGLWQVGRRKGLSFEDMVRLDIEYINRQSLLLDTEILLKTIGIVLDGDGS